MVTFKAAVNHLLSGGRIEGKTYDDALSRHMYEITENHLCLVGSKDRDIIGPLLTTITLIAITPKTIEVPIAEWDKLKTELDTLQKKMAEMERKQNG